jgi:hypothetical protein
MSCKPDSFLHQHYYKRRIQNCFSQNIGQHCRPIQNVIGCLSMIVGGSVCTQNYA